MDCASKSGILIIIIMIKTTEKGIRHETHDRYAFSRFTVVNFRRLVNN